jgi:hypothetical protein
VISQWYLMAIDLRASWQAADPVLARVAAHTWGRWPHPGGGMSRPRTGETGDAVASTAAGPAIHQRPRTGRPADEKSILSLIGCPGEDGGA